MPERLLALARQRLERSCLAVDSEQQVVFHDPRMRKLHELGRHAAAGLINVLLLGETGVGKDVFARAIHRLSPRRNQPFQRIECAALTEALAESELFGHARGAFTGAMRDKPGLLEMADGGTVFLDEVGELPPRLQAKLLHVLETRRITRVGAVEGRAVDLRFIAATNRDLEAESLAGRVPARPVLPAVWVHAGDPAAARAPGGHRPAGPGAGAAVLPAAGTRTRCRR